MVVSISYLEYLPTADSIPIAPSQTTSTTTLSVPRSPVRRGPRTPRKISAQATKLVAVDDTADPLGPLGDKSFENNEEAPVPPQKEPFVGRNVRPTSSASQVSSTTGMMDSVDLEEDGVARAREPPPVQPPADTEGPKRTTQPSVSIEQAAKPTFDITVGDPHKVGDLTSSHIVYQVRTKVRQHQTRNAVKVRRLLT